MNEAGGASGAAVMDAAERRRADLLDELAAMQRVKAEAEAYEQRLLAELDAWVPAQWYGDEPAAVRWRREAWIREEVSCILRIAPMTAGGRLAMATKLVHQLPRTLDALAGGQLTSGHVRAALDVTATLEVENCAAFEARVLARCDDTSVTEFRASCRRTVQAIDPAGAQRRHEAARRTRRFGFGDDEDGMAMMYARMSVADRVRVEQHVNQLADTVEQANAEARGAGGEIDDRTRDAIRLDVAVDLLTGRAGRALPEAGHDIPGTGSGRGAPIQVTVTLSALQGCDCAPAEVDGQPVPAALARELADDPAAWWRPALVDRDGYLEYVGARTYKPGDPLRRLVHLRDRTCRFPGCRRRAMSTEADHVVPFDHEDPTRGGLTVAENLQSLCTRHHRLKHQAGWQVVHDGRYTIWTSPTGLTFEKFLEPYLDPVLETEPAPDPPPY